MRKKIGFLFLTTLLVISTLAACGRKTDNKETVIKDGDTINFYAWAEDLSALEITAEKVDPITDKNINEKIQEYGILPSNVTILSVEKLDKKEKRLQINYSENIEQFLNSLDQSEEYLTKMSIANTFLDAYGYKEVEITANGKTFKTEFTDYSEFIKYNKNLKNPYFTEKESEKQKTEETDEYKKITELFDTIDNSYDGTNLLISPISTYAQLSMLDDAAAGDTKDTLSDFIGDKKKVEDNFASLLVDPNLKLYNAIFYHKGGTDTKEVTVEYSKKLEAYQAELFNSNMNLRDTSLAVINGWVADKTKNDIPKFLTTVSKDTQLYLVGINKFELLFNNPVYNLEFETEEEDTKLVKMMEFGGEKTYYENDSATAIGMDVQGARYKLLCIMPNNSRTKLSSINISELLSNSTTIDKNCYMPIISLNNVVKLNTPLSSAGLSSIFTSNADFSAMFDTVQSSFGVYDIAQINYFNFNSSYNTDSSNELISSTEGSSEGTETATEESVENPDAVSDNNAEKIVTAEDSEELSNDMETIDYANSYVLSQKFYYMLIDNKTNSIIYVGKYSR